MYATKVGPVWSFPQQGWIAIDKHGNLVAFFVNEPDVEQFRKLTEGGIQVHFVHLTDEAPSA